MGYEREFVPLAYLARIEEIFLGRDIVRHRDYSEGTAIEIDNEIKAMVMKKYEEGERIC